MYFSSSTPKSMISWLYTECTQGRLRRAGQSAGSCAVPVRKERLLLPCAPARAARCQPDTQPQFFPMQPLPAENWESLRQFLPDPKQGVALYPWSNVRPLHYPVLPAAWPLQHNSYTWWHIWHNLLAEWNIPLYMLTLLDIKHLNVQLHTPSSVFEMEAIWKMLKNSYKDYFLNLFLWIPIRML